MQYLRGYKFVYCHLIALQQIAYNQHLLQLQVVDTYHHEHLQKYEY